MTTVALITNDDGIDSAGLHALAAMVLDEGWEVVIAAPMGDASGSSAAITSTHEAGHVVVERREIPDLAGVKAYAVAGTPGLISLIASRGGFGKPPELVLSGINHGANIGNAVLHSGTVGAALTASLYGCPAMAVSLDVGINPVTAPHWATAAAAARDLLPLLVHAMPVVAVNLNVPDLPPERLAGRRRGTLASFGAVQTNVEAAEGYVHLTIADTDEPVEPGTDAAWLAQGYVCATPLRAISETEDRFLGRWANR